MRETNRHHRRDTAIGLEALDEARGPPCHGGVGVWPVVIDEGDVIGVCECVRNEESVQGEVRVVHHLGGSVARREDRPQLVVPGQRQVGDPLLWVVDHRSEQGDEVSREPLDIGFGEELGVVLEGQVETVPAVVDPDREGRVRRHAFGHLQRHLQARQAQRRGGAARDQHDGVERVPPGGTSPAGRRHDLLHG